MELGLRIRESTGSSPVWGANFYRGNYMSNWTDELKAQVIAEYEAENPTPETTTEIIAVLADKHEKTVNGIRMILSKAGKYVAKTAASAASASASGEKKAPRKSKQDSLDELTALLESHGVEVDDTVVSKLTGKAAEFFIGAVNAAVVASEIDEVEE
jgi:hypothetical protein